MTAATDTERMARALELAASVRASTLAEPVGGLRAGDGRRSGLRGGHAAGRRAPRRGRRPRRRPGRGCRPGRRHGLDRPSSPARTTAARRPCADALVDAGVGAGRGGARGPRPEGRRRRARPPARAPASTSSSASRRRATRPTCWRRTSCTAAPAARTSCSSWPRRSTGAPPRPTARAAGSPGPRPGPTPTRCGPRATRSSWAPARCGPTTPRSPSATLLRRAAIPSASCSARRPRARRSTRASSGRARCPTCSTSSAPMGHLQLLVEGGATVAHAFHRAGLVDRYVVYLAPALFGGDDAAGLFAGPGAPTIADVSRGAHPLGHAASATTCASTSTPTRTQEALTCSPASSRSWARSSPARGQRLRIAATHRARRRRPWARRSR